MGRQPSVSAQGAASPRWRKLLANDLNTLGFKEVAMFPGRTGRLRLLRRGAPLPDLPRRRVAGGEGRRRACRSRAIKDTDHGRVLMARGLPPNQKGPERAFLNALDSILKTGKLPVNLLIVAG